MGLNGPKHIVKNLVCGLRSAIRTVRVGRYAVDFSAALDLQMPPGAFGGYDGQSDVEACSFLNPWHLRVELHEEVGVPWSLTGAFLINLLGTLTTTAALRPDLSPCQRLENSLAAYVLFDLCALLAHERATDLGLAKGSTWIHRTTQRNIQDLCGLIAIAVTSLPDMDYLPHRSTEITLEQFFGYLRSQMPSPQLTVRDYLHASARRMPPMLLNQPLRLPLYMP